MGSISSNDKSPRQMSDSDFTRYPTISMHEADTSDRVESLGTNSKMARKIAANRSEISIWINENDIKKKRKKK